jgi:catechol 2,3-dioxygenase-like lactoylglutathione lyase family enzyme
VSIEVEYLDHLVLTVRDCQATCVFYSKVLGMEVVIFHQKIGVWTKLRQKT